MVSDKGIKHAAKATLSCALAASLVAPAPVSALAAEAHDSTSNIATQALSKKNDINALWEKQANSTSNQLTLTNAATYYLSADLETDALLAIDAPGKNVTIKLQGHTFTCHEKSMGAAVRVLNAKSVTIEGDNGSIVYQGGVVPCGVKSDGQSLTLRDLTISASTDDKHINLNRHNGYGVQANAGTLTMENCSVSVDMSNQAEALDDSSKSLKESPSGVLIGTGVQAASIKNCKVKAIASPLVERCEIADDTAGYAYALRSLTSKKVSIYGGAFSATCALGDAVAISAPKLELNDNKTKGIKLTAKGGNRSVGIESSQKKGVTLNSKLSMSFDEAYASSVEAALYSTVQSAFVIGSKFSATGLGIYVGGNGLANTEGVVALSLGSKVTFTAKQAQASFVNARSDISSKLVKKGSTFVFAAVASEVKARIGEKGYSSIESALAQVKNGQTITLLDNANDIDVSSSLSSSDSFTVDLNGKSVASLRTNTKAGVVFTDSSNGKAKVTSAGSPALTVSNTGAVTVDGLELTSSSTNNTAEAVSIGAASRVTFNNARISARSAKSTATAIDVTAADAHITASDTRIHAYGEGSANAAYGIKTAFQSDEVSLYGCIVATNTVNGNTAGFEGRGSLLLAPSSSSKTKITANTSGVAATAYGINMLSTSGSTSNCTLDSAVISATSDADASTGEYWSLVSGSADPSSDVSWTFKGENSLVSVNDTHISQRNRPLVFAGNASFSADVVINSTNLDNRKVAVAQNASDDISTAAQRLVPYEKSEFAEWSIADNGTNAEYCWQLRDCARNERTGESFQTISDAIAKAQAGDVITLTEEISTTRLIELSQDITIDLAGHHLQIKAGKDAAAGATGSNAAIVWRGSGTATFKDSLHGGSIDINVGSDTETNTTGSTTYQGFSVIGDGSLIFDECALNLSYTGKNKANAELGLRGVSIVRGNVKLLNGSSLNVTSIPAEEGCIAPVHATGIYGTQTTAPSNSDYAIEIDSSSSVNVVNQAAPIERANIKYPESTSLSDLGISSSSLTRIYPSKDSELYQEIAQKFLSNAKLDSSVEGSSTFDSQIYYAAPMQLDDGTYIWAYSAPVDANNLGDPDYIVPELIFAQTTYQIAAQATGIAGSSTFAGNVNIQGSVNATSTGSSAYALEATGKGTWTVSPSSLNASGSTGSYALVTKTLDLRDYFDLPNQNAVVVYPSSSGSTQKVVEQVEGVSQSIASSSTATVVSPDGTQLVVPPSAEGGQVQAADGRPEKVEVTFGNLRSVDGEREPKATVTVNYGSCLDESDIPPQPDYKSSDGATYRFVGWLKNGSDVIDPRCITELAIDDNISGAIKGSASFTAFYVRVEADEHLVTFKVSNCITAYAVKNGKRASFGAASSGDGKIPAHSSVTGYLYAFKGWHRGWSDDEIWQDGDDVIDTKLEALDTDAVYTARFKVTTAVQKLYLYSWRAGVSGYVYASNPVIEISTGDDFTSLANAIVKPGDVVDTGDITYRFLGWSTRKTDKSPLWTDKLPAVGERRWGDSNSYYAIYEEISQSYTVNFMNNGAQIASAADVKASASIESAFRGTGAATPTASSSGWEFDGWALTENGEALRGSMVTIAQAYAQSQGTDDTLTLYAAFVNSYRPEVYFRTDAGAMISSTTVKYGQSAATAGIEPKASRKLGHYFRGWADSEGTLQDLSTPIENDIDYYASYGKLEVNKALASKVKVSLKRAGVASTDAAGADSVSFTIAENDTASKSIRKRVNTDKGKVLTSYTMSFNYKKGESYTSVNSGFGTITMSLPVKSGTHVKIYWLRSNGTVGATATKTGTHGYVSFALADYGDAEGNLVIATSTTASTPSLTPALRPSASPRPGLNKKPIVAKKPSVDSKKHTGKQTAALSNSDPAATQQDASDAVDADNQSDVQAQEENPAMFYAVLIAILAFAAFLARRLYLFIAKRKEDDLDEELDEVEDDTEESIRF